MVIVEEALDMKPLVRVVRPVKEETPFTCRVPEADRAPATWRPAPIDEEALEIKPLLKVVRPLALSVPEVKTFPLFPVVASTQKKPALKVVELVPS